MRMLFTLQGLPLRAKAMQPGGFVEERAEMPRPPASHPPRERRGQPSLVCLPVVFAQGSFPRCQEACEH